MTLIELMIVVAIVGILVGIAVFMYTRKTRAVKAESEVSAVFAEFKTRQEQFHAENGRYLSTGTADDDYHPGTPIGPDTPQDLAPLPDTWKDLRINADRSHLLCGYVAIAGAGGDSANIGATATLFGMAAAPNTNWYYLVAECDTDGKSAVNMLYFTTSFNNAVAKRNEGR